ncbi:MAG TPA: DUF1573 domain-containing protein [Luteibaculaceae bacterium]|nr:DUF1573 domain-containing protein [Luteibaculaceae bacterium]
MKKLLLATVCLVASVFTVQAQNAPAAVNGGAVIQANKEVHDYGEIKQGGDPYCEFVLKNTGNEPLIISNAKGSCGCTVPEWSREPVMPGKSTVIKVRYDTNRPGPINKSVTITSNAKNEPNLVLRIKGNVAATAEGSTPVKAVPAGAPVDKN